MADTNLFEDQKVDDNQATTENETPTIKVGETEYTQDELDRLVNLGKIGAEAEEKYGVKIDKIWPNHQRTINEKIELEQKLKNFEAQATTTTSNGGEKTKEQLMSEAKRELGELGFVSSTDVEQIVNRVIAGNELVRGVNQVIEDMGEAGYPKTTTNELMQHMIDTGIKVPEKAYKDMFEADIERVKEKKLASLKPNGFITETGSTAGSKAPAPQKVDSKNLRDALAAILPD